MLLHVATCPARAAALCGAEHDLDATRLHKLAADEFWAAFERRYGANPNLVRVGVEVCLCEPYMHASVLTNHAIGLGVLQRRASFCQSMLHAFYSRESLNNNFLKFILRAFTPSNLDV